jgi:sugar lactone lactonase YvrE
MVGWIIERIVHFDFGRDIVRSGLAHFGFHDRRGRYFAVAHTKHFMGLVGEDDRFKWTVAAEPVFADVPNIPAPLEFPMYVDVLSDDTFVVSNFKTAELYRIDSSTMTARLLVEGHALGFKDMGNCVVDDEGYIWVNEVTGCRLWRFDPAGHTAEVLGDGTPSFQSDPVPFCESRFSWIYDIRRGPNGTIYVLDSRNFALRVVDMAQRCVHTAAGDGQPGYDGDGGDARCARFGGDPHARFDGPISLSVDEGGNAYIGDRFNHVVRMIDSTTGLISTIAGTQGANDTQANDTNERDPLRVSLPKISSMDYHDNRLFVPTDLTADSGDLIVLRRHHARALGVS